MDATIVLFLIQDGIGSGAIYALLGFALVLVFTVTRVIFIPQGELVAYGGLTYAALRAGTVPGTVRMLAVFALAALIFALWGQRRVWSWPRAGRTVALMLAPPMLIALTLAATSGIARPAFVDVALTIAIVAPLGPYLYRIAFEPLAGASVLSLFIAAVAVHLAMTALGLAFFGAEGMRAPPLLSGGISVGPILVSGQNLAILGTVLVLILALWLFFDRSLAGKALRATAVNRTGARLVGISPGLAGRVAFGLAAVLAAVSGVLIVPATTLYYDTGFLIGLKGFVAAIVGGLASYPLAGLAALAVGTVEAFAAFQASAYKEVIVFALVIPVLLARSLGSITRDEEH